MSGLKLLGSISQVQDLSRFDLREELFKEGKERDAFEFFRDFVMTYGAIPTEEALDNADVYLYPSDEPVEYHYDLLIKRYTQDTMKRTLITTEDLLKQQNHMEALDLLQAMCVDMSQSQNPNKVVDFAAQGHTHVVGAYKQQLASGDSGISLGWKTPDSMAGGLVGGDVATIVGRPGAGKTYMMLYAALNAWYAGRVPMFVSMEMKPLPVEQRLATMLTQIPVGDLMAGELPTKMFHKMMKRLEEIREAHGFHIVDGALHATIDDIMLKAQQYKPDIVFIDAAYLLRHPNVKLSRWDRATENMEIMKSQLAEGLDIPVVNSHQLNRDAEKKIKKGKADELGVEDIAYTDSVGQISSLVMALLQEEKSSDVEINNRRLVTIMKGRNGESGSFEINWQFSQGPDWMDFSEVEDDLGDLSFE